VFFGFITQFDLLISR